MILSAVITRLRHVTDFALRSRLFTALLALLPEEEMITMVERLLEREDLEAIRKPLSTIMQQSSSLRAVMKSRVTTWNELVQHKMNIANLDHGRT